jgi:hypothetical protein
MAVRRTLSAIAVTAVCTCAPYESLASPRSDPTAGRAVFTGSTLAHPTSLTLNPAALSVDRSMNDVYVAALAALQQSSVALDAGDDVTDLQLSPGGQVTYVGRPSERLALGGGLLVLPREMHLEDHQALRYSTLGGGQRNYIATVGVSLKLLGRVHIGASLSHDNTSLELRYARDTSGGLAQPDAMERYDVRVRSPWVSSSNLHLNIGVVVRVATDVWIGVAYHTPPGLEVQTGLTGHMTVTRAPRDGGEVLHGGSVVEVSYPASVDGEVRARLWRDLELHVGGRWEDLSRFSAYDVRGFGTTLTNAGIPAWQPRARGLHDAFSVWAGLEQHDTGEQLLLGGRIGYETSSVDAWRTSPLTIAPAALTIDLGVQARLAHGAPWWLQLSYGLALSPTVSGGEAFDPRHRLDCEDSGFDYTSAGCRLTRGGYDVAAAAGDYGRIMHSLRVGFRYEWP